MQGDARGCKGACRWLWKGTGDSRQQQGCAGLQGAAKGCEGLQMAVAGCKGLPLAAGGCGGRQGCKELQGCKGVQLAARGCGGEGCRGTKGCSAARGCRLAFKNALISRAVAGPKI